MNAFGPACRRTFCVLVLASLAAVRAPHAADAPEPGLPMAAPEAVGVDSTLLVRLSEGIRNDRLDVRSLLLVKDGKLVFERYGGGLDRDYNYELYSVTKTVTSLVFGVLAGEGKIKPSDKVATWIAKAHPEFRDALKDKQDIELRHLLSMSSGLYYKQPRAPIRSITWRRTGCRSP
jgi:CubicO group peptidase (beta-lactamase class C family)